MFRNDNRFRSDISMQRNLKNKQIPEQRNWIYPCRDIKLLYQQNLDFQQSNRRYRNTIRTIHDSIRHRIGNQLFSLISFKRKTKMELLFQQSHCNCYNDNLEFLRKSIVYIQIKQGS